LSLVSTGWFTEITIDNKRIYLFQVQMKEVVMDFKHKLDTQISKSSNLSAGQRQLLCLGRALLKKTKILLIEESADNIDIQ